MCQAPALDSDLPSFLFGPPRPANPASPSSRLSSFVLSVPKPRLLFKAEPTGNVSLWPTLNPERRTKRLEEGVGSIWTGRGRGGTQKMRRDKNNINALSINVNPWERQVWCHLLCPSRHHYQQSLHVNN